ncbi:mitogen-activated protein kinase kinase kinase YODA isoform X2 [Citrus clementina]|uniref:mitogen-activated protein kinase kinase kinase YODA isoform X2 n=1 Tax=Citrus clementina TaxID=85681 RepID=UPI000CED0200|nr:mitogen-activated protein kinase kinase kinase YODA isoform X2 [Citrus x clementina]
MPSWWGKSSSKEEKKKVTKESFIDAIHRKFKIGSDESRSGGTRRSRNDTVSERGSLSRLPSRSPSPSTHVSRCQSFAERSRAQPLPLPGVHLATLGRTESAISASTKPRFDRGSKPMILPLPTPGCVPDRLDTIDAEGDLATASVSSDSSTDSDDPSDSRLLTPLTSDYENGNKSAVTSPTSMMEKAKYPVINQKSSGETIKPANLLINNHILSASLKKRHLSSHVQKLQIPPPGAFCSAPDSSISSPSRSPMRAFGQEQVLNAGLWTGKPYSDIALLGSGHCSSPGSGHNSGHNSVGGDMSGQLFWPHSRCSPECSPIPSPRMTSPGPSSRIHSGAVTPLHPRAGGGVSESPSSRPDDVKQQSHRLPLPPLTISNTCPFSPSYSTATSPSVPRSPGRVENPTSPGSRWKKGRLLGRGTFGHVYLGFNSESGEMCAMKEVTLFSDDAKSKESAQQLGQEIALLSRLRHPNIVRYYGSETITGQSCPLSFKGSPYWMAPEVIKNSNGCNLAVDIWSLGCTVIEMATTKPPWSQYEGVPAMFKIGNSKELPAIPDHLSDEGKDFVRKCLQRNPLHRPTAAQLLEHPFVGNAAPLERPILSAEPSETKPTLTVAMRILGMGLARTVSGFDLEGVPNFQSRGLKTGSASDAHTPRNVSCPVSPIGSPLLHPRSPQHTSGWVSPSPISSPHTASGSSTPITGGSGAIPFHHPMPPSTYLHEGIGVAPRSQNSFHSSSSNLYQDPDLFRGMSQASHVFREIISSDRSALANQFGRPGPGDLREFYDGQPVLADDESQQLSKDHGKSNLPLDLNPGLPMLGRTNRI